MNIQKLNSSVSPFAGISLANNSFNKRGISQLIDNELGRRMKAIGFDYSEILRNLSNVFLSGGGVIEDISTHLGEHLKMIPGNNVPSPDTVLRAIKELSTPNTSFKSNSSIDYDFNINARLNRLNIKVLLQTGQLAANHSYDFDYDNQVVVNNKYDAKRTYKKNKGYVPGCKYRLKTAQHTG